MLEDVMLLFRNFAFSMWS